MASTLNSSWLGLCTLQKVIVNCYKDGRAMLLAAFRNHDKCVQALKGADVIVRNSIISTVQGCTPGNGHLTTLKTVRDVGDDVNTMNLDGIRRGDCDCGHDGDIIEVIS